MTDKEYRALGRVSKSDLDLINKCPAKYKYSKLFPLPKTPQMEFGTALHSAILEPDLFVKEFAIEPELDRRTKAGKEAFNMFLEEANGKTVITREDFEKINGIKDSLLTKSFFINHLNAGETEKVVLWQEPVTGFHCKSKVDLVNVEEGVLIDLKTTHSAHPSDFKKSIASYRYHVQAAFYMDAVKNSTGKEIEQFIFVAVEKDPPYLSAMYTVKRSDIERGRVEYLKDIDKLQHCIEKDHWPSYSDEIEELNLPNWY